MKKIFFILSLVSMTTFFVADAQVRIVKVDPVANTVTLKNFGASTASVTTYWLCNQITYVQLAGLTPISGSPLLLSGGEVTYPRLLNNAGSDIGLYSSSGFSNAANMLDFMQYGGSFPFPSGRENVAVTKGIWTAGEFVSGTGPYYYFGDGTTNGASTWGPGAQVTFNVDLALETAISDSGVHITGSFQGFDPGSDEMTNSGGTSYTYTTILPVGDTVKYKYVNGNAFDGSEETATPLACSQPPTADRVLIVPATDTIIPEVCFEACVPCSQINSVNVTFQVDMANEIVSPNGVHIAGNFQGFNPGSDEMINVGGSVYAITLSIPLGTPSLIYKFINGNTFIGEEEVMDTTCAISDGFGGLQRESATPTSDTTFPVVCFASCGPCVPASQFNVTLQVDMSNETVSDSGIHVAGSFQGWDPSATPLSDIGNGVWAVTVPLIAGTNYQYKFINGNQWGLDEAVFGPCGDGSGNRALTGPNSDSTIAAACFRYCSPCADLVDVTFQVNMSDQTVSGDGVHIAGTFNGFDAAATQMTSAGGGIYSATVTLDPGHNIEYRYLNGNVFADSTDEVGDSLCGVPSGFGQFNRTLTVPISNTTLPPVCFGECVDCNPCPTPQNLNSTNVTATSVTLNWEQSANAIGYEIQGGLQGSNPANYVSLTVNGGATTSFNVANLTTNLTFEWTVRAICSPDQTVVSDFAPLSFFSTTCPAPGTAFTSNVTASSATLNWGAAAGALGYEVVGQALGGPLVTLVVVGNANTTFQVNNLPSGVAFQWQVRSICTADGSAKSIFSNSSTFMTLGASEKNGITTQGFNSELSASVFPNPAGNQVTVQFASNEVVNVKLFDLNGKIVADQQSISGNSFMTIDVNQIQNGVYQLVIEGKNAYQVEKLVIAK